LQQQHDFETTLLNAKMAELQKEIDRYQKENAALSSGRRKLQHDRKQLAKGQLISECLFDVFFHKTNENFDKFLP
jgi:hypothetical protein